MILKFFGPKPNLELERKGTLLMSMKASESQKDRNRMGAKKFRFSCDSSFFFLLKTVVLYCLFSNMLWNSVHYQRKGLLWHI